MEKITTIKGNLKANTTFHLYRFPAHIRVTAFHLPRCPARPSMLPFQLYDARPAQSTFHVERCPTQLGKYKCGRAKATVVGVFASCLRVGNASAQNQQRSLASMGELATIM
jgi:hypothetical protein